MAHSSPLKKPQVIHQILYEHFYKNKIYIYYLHSI